MVGYTNYYGWILKGGNILEIIVVEKSPPLKGKVRVNGAKNSALPILAASLLGTEDIILEVDIRQCLE